MAEEQEMNEQQQEDGLRDFSAPPESASSGIASSENLRVLENIEVQLSVEVGNAEIKIRDLFAP